MAGAEGCIGLMGLVFLWLMAIAAVASTFKLLGDGNFVLAASFGLVSAVLLCFVLAGHIEDDR